MMQQLLTTIQLRVMKLHNKLKNTNRCLDRAYNNPSLISSLNEKVVQALKTPSRPLLWVWGSTHL